MAPGRILCAGAHGVNAGRSVLEPPAAVLYCRRAGGDAESRRPGWLQQAGGIILLTGSADARYLMSDEGLMHKKRMIALWNEMAMRYHERWAGSMAGPFQIARSLKDALAIKSGSRILDLGCGTGLATNHLYGEIEDGLAVGLDSSLEAVRIAKRQGGADFFVADAESFHLRAKFDAVLCQFALFFFPDAVRALRCARNVLKKSGTLGVIVHGRAPYFDIILSETLKVIPDYLPGESPDLSRYGTFDALRDVASEAGFSDIRITEYEYEYSPGTAAQYWDNYVRYVPRRQKSMLDELPRREMQKLRESVTGRAQEFEKGGRVVFPWQVLLLAAKP